MVCHADDCYYFLGANYVPNSIGTQLVSRTSCVPFPPPNLVGTHTSDADLDLVRQFPNLDNVRLDARHLTDRGTKSLAELPKLWALYIQESFDDACVEHLKNLPRITNLDAYGSRVTDVGIERLSAVAPQVERVNLSHTQISDIGLRHLRSMPKLAWVELHVTKVTAAGVAELQPALPNCKIDWSPTLPPPTGDPNRDAAEWVPATGGEVWVVPPGAKESVVVCSSHDLPASPWHLNGAILRGLGVHDDDFARVAGLAELIRIEIRNCNISGAALERIGTLAGLSGLRIHACPVGDAGVAWSKNFPNLTVLDLKRCNIAGAELADIAAMWQLRHLELDDNSGITDEGLAHLTQLRGLQELLLNGTSVTDAGMEHLRRLKQLKLLGLVGTAVSDQGLVALGDLAALTRLGVAGTRISDAGLPALSNLRKLKTLDINDTIITDVGMAEIAKLDNLESLTLRGARVGDDGLAELKPLTKLEYLGLAATEITDEGLKRLHALTNLKHLDVTSTQVTAAGIADLKAALPNCEVIHDASPAAASGQ